MKNLFKVLISAYIIMIVPAISTGFIMEYVINNKYIASIDGMTNGYLALYMTVAMYILDQIAVVILVNRFIFKNKLTGKMSFFS